MLLIVSSVMTPYRLRLHQRIATELPGVETVVMLTHAGGTFDWALSPSPLKIISYDIAGDASVPPLKKRFDEARATRRILADARSLSPAAVIMEGYSDVPRLALLSHCARTGLPIFVRGDSNARSPRPRRPVAFAKDRLVRWVIENTSGVMPVGTLGRDYFESYGADPDRTFVVPYEPDYHGFEAVDEDKLRAFEQAHGFDPGKQAILFTGRLIRHKRVDLLIDAFQVLADERPNWDLFIVGTGSLEAELRSQVSRTLRHRVHWLGFLDVEDLTHAYHAADLLVLPSEFEPWAVVVNEAMAAGLPVVASDVVGAAADLVEDGANGRVFTAGDLNALVDAMRDVTDPDKHPRFVDLVPRVLGRWRREADPIIGINNALRSVGITTSAE